MWYRYEITYRDINGKVLKFIVRSEDENNLIGVARSWERNYRCKKLLKVVHLDDSSDNAIDVSV